MTGQDTLYFNDDFAEMRGAFHHFKSLFRLSEFKYAVNNRFNTVRRNRPVHLLEHFARADENALHTNVMMQDFDGVNFRTAAA